MLIRIPLPQLAFLTLRDELAMHSRHLSSLDAYLSDKVTALNTFCGRSTAPDLYKR